jgi:hypothetical protein
MVVVPSASEALRNCLQRIGALLEKGEAVQAAAIVSEMTEIFPRLPMEMSPDELAEASNLLAHCAELERGLRQNVLVSLQRLAATKKSMVYRRYLGRS